MSDTHPRECYPHDAASPLPRLSPLTRPHSGPGGGRRGRPAGCGCAAKSTTLRAILRRCCPRAALGWHGCMRHAPALVFLFGLCVSCVHLFGEACVVWLASLGCARCTPSVSIGSLCLTWYWPVIMTPQGLGQVPCAPWPLITPPPPTHQCAPLCVEAECSPAVSRIECSCTPSCTHCWRSWCRRPSGGGSLHRLECMRALVQQLNAACYACSACGVTSNACWCACYTSNCHKSPPAGLFLSPHQCFFLRTAIAHGMQCGTMEAGLG